MDIQQRAKKAELSNRLANVSVHLLDAMFELNAAPWNENDPDSVMLRAARDLMDKIDMTLIRPARYQINQEIAAYDQEE